MPTTFPVRAVEPDSDDGLASFCRALLGFYAGLALALMSLAAIEMQSGMHSGSSVPQAVFEPSGIDVFANAFRGGSLAASARLAFIGLLL